jgi:hypothetical protein
MENHAMFDFGHFAERFLHIRLRFGRLSIRKCTVRSSIKEQEGGLDHLGADLQFAGASTRAIVFSFGPKALRP